MGENLKVVYAKFSTICQAVLLHSSTVRSTHATASRVENSAQVSSCSLKFVPEQGQTSANSTKYGPIFQFQKRPFAFNAFMVSPSKTAQLKVENSGQTTSRFSPIRYRTPRHELSQLLVPPRCGSNLCLSYNGSHSARLMIFFRLARPVANVMKLFMVVITSLLVKIIEKHAHSGTITAVKSL